MAFAETFWFVVTAGGDPRVWLPVAAVLALIRNFTGKPNKKRFGWVKQLVVFSCFAMMIALGVSEATKNILQIPRPCTPCPADNCNSYCDGTYSFPSGHTTAAFAFFGSIYYTILKKKKYAWVFLLPIIVGLSRVALGVHTWADIFSGAALGLATMVIYIELIRKVKIFRKWTS